jgi:S-adenosylmethionine uptake transporter
MQSLWMLAATFLFAAMGVCVKLASDWYSTSEIVMYRGIVGMLFIYLLTRFRGGTLKTAVPWSHVSRGVVGVGALWLWFYSISLLPLAMSMTLNYTAPIWMAAILFALGWWRGQSRFEWGLAAAIAASFVGITLLLRPSIHADQWLGGLIALGSGVLSAFAYLHVRRLGKLGEPEYRVVFYFSATGVVAGLLGCVLTPVLQAILTPASPIESWVSLHRHSSEGLMLLLGIGMAAALAQMALTRAYHLGKTLVSANLQYTGIVFSSLWGIMLWDENLNMLGWLGIAIIVASGIAATYYSTRSTTSATTSTRDAAAAQAKESSIWSTR